MAAAADVQPSNPFTKQLASSDRKIRERALSSLRTYLHRSAPFTPLDFLKIWKGLFYCMWMQDKPRNQQRLARDLADLADVLQTNENLLGFIEAFWKTMAREWGNIDALRMDKYLYLVRCYVSKGFAKCATDEWQDEQLLDGYLKILGAVPLNPRDPKVPNGVRYHVIDIYVDELDKVDTARNVPLDKVLGPLRRLGVETITKTVRSRAQEALEDERLSNWAGEGEEDEEDEDAQAQNGSTNSTDADAGTGENNEDEEFGGFGD